MWELLGLFDLAKIDRQSVNAEETALVAEANISRSNNDRLIAAELPQTKEQKIIPDRNNLKYPGRVNWKDPQAPAFSYSGTATEFNFTGTSLKIELSEHNWGGKNYLDVYLDDNPEPVTIKLQGNGSKPLVYDIATNLENKPHRATIVKRTDYVTGHFQLHGIITDGELLPATPLSSRKIEVYGDSISAGAATEYEQTGVREPSGNNDVYANSYYSYASVLARNYDADLALIAQSGASLIDGYGFWHGGTGMEAFYNRIAPLDDAALWDFNNYQPDLVIVALGQNDSASINIDKDMTAAEWKARYKQFIANLRSQHPNAYFIGMFPNMYHDREWDGYLTEAIAEYRQENSDERVFSLIHEQVTPGHPRISEQQLMADTLQEFIDGTLSNEGFNWGLAN